jgi:MFS family permease
VGWVFAVAAAGALATTVGLSRVADRIDRMKTMVCAVALIGAGNVLLATSLPLTGYMADTVVLTLAFSPLFILSYALCADGAEEAGTGSGTAMGALNTVWATGALCAPVVAGKLAGAGGDGVAFALVAVVAALAAVGLLQARRADAVKARNVEAGSWDLTGT